MIGLNWYALFVETGMEETVQHWLKQQFEESRLRSLVPKRIVPERKQGFTRHVVRKMFPGYVLIRTSMDAELYHDLRRIPHVLKLLTNGRWHEQKQDTLPFSTIQEAEITPLLRLLNQADILEFSTLSLIPKSNIHVLSGPLKGMESFIKKIDRHKNRATLQIPFLGEERTIEVGILIMNPASEC